MGRKVGISEIIYGVYAVVGNVKLIASFMRKWENLNADGTCKHINMPKVALFFIKYASGS
jgi:hypothetical protein